ncbi:kinesin-like protein KIF2A [Biomphalaria glabrata]|nr:Biomphalaria glabrata kinesin-like protein KIF2A [Biomphalaria glabrata]
MVLNSAAEAVDTSGYRNRSRSKWTPSEFKTCNNIFKIVATYLNKKRLPPWTQRQQMAKGAVIILHHSSHSPTALERSADVDRCLYHWTLVPCNGRHIGPLEEQIFQTAASNEHPSMVTVDVEWPLMISNGLC